MDMLKSSGSLAPWQLRPAFLSGPIEQQSGGLGDPLGAGGCAGAPTKCAELRWPCLLWSSGFMCCREAKPKKKTDEKTSVDAAAVGRPRVGLWPGKDIRLLVPSIQAFLQRAPARVPATMHAALVAAPASVMQAPARPTIRVPSF